MASRFETQIADEWTRGFGEFKETIVRRVNGDPDKTEDVEAVVELDGGTGFGGFVSGDRGDYIQAEAVIEISASQAWNHDDKAVIRGLVYPTIGGPVSSDAATKTIALGRREPIRDRKPRTRG